MNNLIDIAEYLYAKGFTKKQLVFGGWYLLVGKDRYGLALGVFFKNNEKISEKDLLAGLPKKPSELPAEAEIPKPPKKPKPVKKEKSNGSKSSKVGNRRGSSRGRKGRRL